MNKLFLRLKSSVLLSLSLLLLTAAQTPVRAGTINSLIASNDSNYLGIGFNSVTKKYITDNTCLTFRNIGTESADRVNTASYYCFVDSQQALEEKFLYNFAATAGTTPDSTAISKVTEAIVNDTVFSADKITMIAYWKQEEKKLYSADLPILSHEAASVLNNNSRSFYKTYGDKYVSGVTTGKVLYIVYQTDITGLGSYAERARKPIKQAMEINIKKILGAKLTPSETDFVTSQLANCPAKIYTYGNNVDPFVGPYSADDLKDAVKKINNGPSTIISSELKDFSATANRRDEFLTNIGEYTAMVRAWNNHLSNLNYILANPRISFNLSADCRAAIKEINSNLVMVNSLASEARMPSAKEQDMFAALYKRYIIELQIIPRTYYLPTIKGTQEIDLRKINDVDTIKIIYFHPPKDLMWYLLLRKTAVGLLMLDKDNNWSVLNSYLIGNNKTITLYEGVKFCDKFLISFSSAKMRVKNIKVIVSFTEKIDDLIWNSLRSQNKR